MELSAEDERLIELSVIGSGSLDGRDRSRVNTLVESDPAARAIREEFERFYVEFDGFVESDSSRASVDRLLVLLGLISEP